ncbi:MAG: hypothetical protein WBR15_07005 [Gammaproteobacteria bacterium]
MSKRYFAIGLGTAAVFMSGVASAFCSAPPPKVCSAYFQADVVVRGKVLSVQRNADWIHYKISIEKTFKGQQLPTRYFDTGNDSGRLSLDAGAKYVLFAYRNDNRLEIGCDEEPLSDPSKVAVVSAEIERLQASKQTFAIIEGEVLAADYSSPLPGVSVVATGLGGIHRVVSNNKGLFSMRVPPGLYSVHVAPNIVEQTIYSEIYTNPESIHLEPGQCAQLQYAGVRR